MALPAPYVEADDQGLVDGCIRDDPDAWTALLARYGPLVELVAVRAVDERRTGPLDEVRGCVESVVAHLRRNRAGPLRTWCGQSLRHYVAAHARQVAISYLQDVTPPATSIASLPTPAAVFLDEVLGAEPAKQVTDALDRLPPNFGALVRLRLRGLDRSDIAATLGKTQQMVVSHLERVAERLGSMAEGQEAEDVQDLPAASPEHPGGVRAEGAGGPRMNVEDTCASWRVVLDAATIAERVAVAMRTETDQDFRKVRALTEATWHVVRERAFTRLFPKQALCLDENAFATYVDGTLRGADRTRAEGHVATCARCIDTVATLTMDVRAADIRREADAKHPGLGLIAACIATTRFRAAVELGKAAAEEGSSGAFDLVRLARIGQSLEGGAERQASEPSRVRALSTTPPADEEAPLVAIEALVANDIHSAARAIDDELAKTALGARLRLLADVAGHDVENGRALATELVARPHSDPGLNEDAAAAVALPEGRALPREVLVERLRHALPLAVRWVLNR